MQRRHHHYIDPDRMFACLVRTMSDTDLKPEDNVGECMYALGIISRADGARPTPSTRQALRTQLRQLFGAK